MLRPLARRLERWLDAVRRWPGGTGQAVNADHEGPGNWRVLVAALLAQHQWADRAVVIAYAAITGAVVLVFTLLAEGASAAHAWLRQAAPLAPLAALLWTPALSAALLWWLRRFAPATAGSGVPQVVRALDDDLVGPLRAQLVSLRLSLHKIGLVCGGMLAGLSIGREGPTVQVGAGVMVHAGRWLSPQSRIDEHDLMVAGAAAGIAAAFNTPLGGIVFALEQLSRRRGIAHSTLVIAAIVLAGLVAVATFGNETYFGRLRVQSLGWDLLLPGFLVAVVSGLAGGLFSRLLVLSGGAVPDRWTRWRSTYPYRFALGCAAAVALIGLASGGQTAGAGYAPTRAMLEAQSDLPVVYTVLKMCATWLSVWTGLPAGVFSPSLAIGAGIGHDVAAAAGVAGEAAIPLIALGMVGFLAAVTQGPITAFIIVMEMVAGHAMVLSLMACAMVSAGLSRLVAHPLYAELARLIRIERPAPPAGPPGPAPESSNPAFPP